jgi:alginate O-acetyltransferase complex protein AlgI
MLFSSPVFFLFLALFLLTYRLIPREGRLGLVIVASTVFYGYWNPGYAALPYLMTALAFILAIWSHEAGPGRRWRLTLAIAIMLTPLLIFKYTNFIARQFLGPDTVIVTTSLPLGLSFVTFTLLAYVIDVHRGRYPCSRSPSQLLAFTLFFPHLIAGPILRPHELMPQLRRLSDLVGRKMILGLAIFTLGLTKKLVIADPIAGAVDSVYRSPAAADMLSSLVAIYGFTIQIYCDFSGYTDMAIGCALIMGIKLPNNFARPYAAVSPIDFWRRWHITLSHWLRDYIYIPLGGNRRGVVRQDLNIMVTMLLGGLWHGANWTFVVWGGLHGLALVVNHGIRRLGLMPGYGRLPQVVRALVVFHLAALLWVFFRSPNLATVGAILGGLARPGGNFLEFLDANAFILALFGLFFATHHLDDHRRLFYGVRHWGQALALAVMAIAWIMAITISTGSSGKFIYFDF